MSDIAEGMSDSPEGDPKVLFVLNLILSVTFAAVVIWLGALVGIGTFEWSRVAVFAVFLMILTYVVTM